MPDGSKFDGKHLFSLVRDGKSPFEDAWDVNLLIQELEANLGAAVTDIPLVCHCSNNHGFHVRLSNGLDIVARLARGDVNMPEFDGFPIHVQIPEDKFEAAVYKLLGSERDILASHLLYHRPPLQHPGPRLERPRDIMSRRLLVFERTEGKNNIWDNGNPENGRWLFTQCARIRAALFNFQLPLDFATTWFLDRLFKQKREVLPGSCCSHARVLHCTFHGEIEATIRNLGDMRGWESDNNTVGPIAVAAKQSLLRLIPHILPADDSQTSPYRLVLEHDDFGIHNMSIATDVDGRFRVTSLYDWETGCIVPAILSDPLLKMGYDFMADENAEPSLGGVDSDDDPSVYVTYGGYAKGYFEDLFRYAPDYKAAIQAGKDARRLWFALRDWRGQDPEG